MQTTHDKKIVYTVKEVSELLHTNPTYVYNLIKAELLPVLKLGSYKVRQEALNKFLADYEGKDVPSHVLKAIGLSDKQALSSIRISYGRYNTLSDVEKIVSDICDAYQKIVYNLAEKDGNIL